MLDYVIRHVKDERNFILLLKSMLMPFFCKSKFIDFLCKQFCKAFNTLNEDLNVSRGGGTIKSTIQCASLNRHYKEFAFAD